ncbi:hypothetical protein [Paludibacterium denitrificans]|uniref:Uncharacterized protein n=1 Tax=Paludibacterium denitrificans TaxID=2675226 RepID=A0A844GDZ3_9NEIS|nr:hypothetical protein [Paludibacterium denitrificans]MTD33869.1 hypothetical protein [Paludibacterium denitrificans]
MEPSICYSDETKNTVGTLIEKELNNLGEHAYNIAVDRGFHPIGKVETPINVTGFVAKSIDKDSGSATCAFSFEMTMSGGKDNTFTSKGLVQFTSMQGENGRTVSLNENDLISIVNSMHRAK